MNTPNALKDYYIAYFDILGYKQYFIENPDKINVFLESINGCITEFIARTKIANQNIDNLNMAGTGKLEYKLFSDNVLICYSPEKIDDVSFIAFLKITAEIQDMFINRYQLFIRGGVTIGKLSFNENYIFGAGLIRAVELEGKAKSPRIIVDNNLLCLLSDNDIDTVPASCVDCSKYKGCSKHKQQLQEELVFRTIRNSAIRKDADGEWYISYLDETNSSVVIFEQIEAGLPYNTEIITQEMILYYRNNKDDFIAQNTEYCISRLHNHRKVLFEKATRYGYYTDMDFSKPNVSQHIQERQNVICKYKWAVDYHNSICDQFKHHDLKIGYELANMPIMLHDVTWVVGMRIIEAPDHISEVHPT